jgi:hypothetical protein
MNPSVCESRRFVGGPAISTVPLAPPSIALFGNQIKMFEKVSTRCPVAHRLARPLKWPMRSLSVATNIGTSSPDLSVVAQINSGLTNDLPDKFPFFENKNNILFGRSRHFRKQ